MSQNILYALPKFSITPLFTPIYVVQGVYAKYYGLSLAAIAAVMIFVRIFDAITDPLIGYWSDRYRLKHGTRKPFIAAGVFLMLGSGYFLYSPPENAGIFYFAFWFTLIFIGFTLFEIPHLALGGEITHESHSKTRRYNLRTAAGYGGAILFYSIPLLPVWDSADITPETLHFSATASIALTLPLLYFCLRQVPDGHCYTNKCYTNKCYTSENHTGKNYSGKAPAQREKPVLQTPLFLQLSLTWKSVIYNPPLLLFLSAFTFSGIGLGMWYGLVFIFVDAYLDQGDKFAEINLTVYVIGALSSLLWVRIAGVIGKKGTWLAALMLGLLAFVYTGFISPENATYGSLLLLLAINIACFVCIESLPQSMLSDIVDYSAWKFGEYHGSTYFSLYLFIYKAAFALGSALGLAIAGWYGFDPAAANQSDRGIFGLTLAMTWVPALFLIISIVFVALSPITLRRHRVVRRRLGALETRAKRKPQTPEAYTAAPDLIPVKSTS